MSRDEIQFKPFYKYVTGELAGQSSAARQLPDVPCQEVWIKAVVGNTGNVYIGDSTVTVVDGTTDTTSGIELDAGDIIGPIRVDNLNKFYLISDNDGDDLTYLAAV